MGRSFGEPPPKKEIYARKNQKSPMSIKFPPVILGPDMAAPILWAPGIFWLFLLENPMPIKFLLLGGEGVLGFFRRGGGSANFIFMGVGIFPIEENMLQCENFGAHDMQKRQGESEKKRQIGRSGFNPFSRRHQALTQRRAVS